MKTAKRPRSTRAFVGGWVQVDGGDPLGSIAGETPKEVPMGWMHNCMESMQATRWMPLLVRGEERGGTNRTIQGFVREKDRWGTKALSYSPRGCQRG